MAELATIARPYAEALSKAIGTDESNDVIPGGGPLTQYHNTVLQEPDAAHLNAALQTALLATKTD